MVRVVFETRLGEVEIAVYPSRAPLSGGNFLAYVDAGHYDGARLYRAVRKSAPGTIGVVQGGLLAAAMSGDSPYLDRPNAPFPPIAHETTETTGIPNERGTIALARLEPGTASSEFFFNLSDNPELDTGAGVTGRDGFGYATFGRVVRGWAYSTPSWNFPRTAKPRSNRSRDRFCAIRSRFFAPTEFAKAQPLPTLRSLPWFGC